jgi:hypothetical protein
MTQIAAKLSVFITLARKTARNSINSWGMTLSYS